MSGKASNSQPAAGFSGSGALSHVYIQYPPLRFGIPGSRGLFYDDGNRLLLSPTSDQIFAWKVVPFSPDNAPTSDSISDGPIVSIRFSLDGKLVAIQRSSHEIQLQDRVTGETFTQRCKSESESILGFFWTDCPLCDIVFVKTSGLDFFTYNSDSKTLHLVETRKLNISWYVYTHESRLVLLASGMQCKNFTGFQAPTQECSIQDNFISFTLNSAGRSNSDMLSSAGIIRLPKFEMVMAKTEANSKPVLAVEDVYIVTAYGRIYCLQVDRVAMLLHSYRFYRDAVVQQGSLPIYSSKIAISVVDNVLLVHQVDAKVIILYDIFLDSRAPISAPLPLLLRGLPRSSSIGSRSSSRNGDSPEATYLSDNEATVYGDDWNFLMPDLVCDFSNKLLWKLNLDLEAIAASNSEVSSVLDFLQRRKLEAYKAKHICLAMIRTAILERRPLSMVSRSTDVVVTSYAHSLKTATSKPTKGDKIPATATANAQSSSRLDRKSVDHLHAGLEDDYFERWTYSGTDDTEDNGPFEQARTESNNKAAVMGAGTTTTYKGESLFNASTSEQQDPQLSSAVISPDEMYSFVFAPVEEEMAGDPSYLIAIIIDFLRSASSEKIKVHPNMFVLMVQLLARNERFAELGMFVINKIIEPSKEVAMQLLESGRQNHETRKLGLDMLRQLSLHHDYLVFLVQEGYYLEALRYVRKHKVTTVRPSLFLEAASASNDPEQIAAVLRFYTDYIPGFSHTPDYTRYYLLLNEISAGPA